MSKKTTAIPFPQLNLKAPDFFHEFPEEAKYELCIEYKLKGVPRDLINVLDSVEKVGTILAVTNRSSEYRYRYPIKDI